MNKIMYSQLDIINKKTPLFHLCNDTLRNKPRVSSYVIFYELFHIRKKPLHSRINVIKLKSIDPLT